MLRHDIHRKVLAAMMSQEDQSNVAVKRFEALMIIGFARDQAIARAGFDQVKQTSPASAHDANPFCFGDSVSDDAWLNGWNLLSNCI